MRFTFLCVCQLLSSTLLLYFSRITDYFDILWVVLFSIFIMKATFISYIGSFLRDPNNCLSYPYFMKKLIPLLLYFVCISSASAQSTISVFPECHSKTDTVRVIWDMCYNYKSQQLTEWANAIEQTRPLTVEELNQFFEAKMILLSEYSAPSNKTFSLCDKTITIFNTNK